MIDSILHVLVTGCAWRQLPHDLVPWARAYRWFAAWVEDGTWDTVHDRLREQVRFADGRDAQPSAAVLDSQSAKSAEGGVAIGYDAGKRVRGRERHLLVDTNGLVLEAKVHTASLQDRPGAKRMLTGVRQRFPVLPRRCWLGRCRRLARAYERKTTHAEAMIEVAMIRLMAARLAGEEIHPTGAIETEAARRLDDDLDHRQD